MTTQTLPVETTAQRTSNPLGKRLRRSSFMVLAIVIALMISGFGLNQIATIQDAHRYPAPGTLVDVGGFKLHLNISGETGDSPTVILEAGNGGFSTQWVHIQAALEAETQVVSYDRAGLGWSEDSGQSRDVVSAARQLRTALDNAGVAGPYVLVGHSLGGLFVRAFADQYRNDIAGVVLIDTAHPDAMSIYPEAVAQSQQMLRQFSDVATALAPFGVIRLTGPLFAEGIAGLPETQAEASRAIGVTTGYLRAFNAEYHAWFPTMNDQVRQMADFEALPLVVLSANQFPNGADAPEGYWDAHFMMQADLATLSSNGDLRIVEGADHYSLLMDKTHSQAVIQAIRDVLNRA